MISGAKQIVILTERQVNGNMTIDEAEKIKIEDVNMFQLGYNKAIDDFIKECDKCCGYYKGKNKIITRDDMLMIAEKLKATLPELYKN